MGPLPSFLQPSPLLLLFTSLGPFLESLALLGSFDKFWHFKWQVFCHSECDQADANASIRLPSRTLRSTNHLTKEAFISFTHIMERFHILASSFGVRTSEGCIDI